MKILQTFYRMSDKASQRFVLYLMNILLRYMVLRYLFIVVILGWLAGVIASLYSMLFPLL